LPNAAGLSSSKPVCTRYHLEDHPEDHFRGRSYILYYPRPWLLPLLAAAPVVVYDVAGR